MGLEPEPPAAARERVELRPATAGEMPWLLALAGSADVEPYLAPGAVQGLAAAVEAGEALVASAPVGRGGGGVRAMVVSERSRIAAIRTLMIAPAARGRGLAVAVVH